MDTKKTIRLILFTFLAAGVVYLGLQNIRKPSVESAQINQTALITDADVHGEQVLLEQGKTADVVYYFHTNARCVTCVRMQNFTRETLERDFAGELEAGEMIWAEVNLDNPENRHFIKDFELAFRTVVIANVAEGNKVTKWKNLERVWEFVGDRDRFMGYISDEIKGFRGEL